MITIILIAIIIAVTAFSAYNIKTLKNKEKTFQDKISSSNKDKEESNIKAEEIILDAKNKALEIQKKAEEKEFNAQKSIAENEKNIAIKEELLKRKEEEIQKIEENIKKTNDDLEKIKSDLSFKLEKIAALTKEDAKKILLEQVDKDLQDEKAKRIKENENEIKSKSEDISKNILIETMQKTVSEYIGPATTAIVDLPNDDIKGKIIGKEGRNIRAFEKITGVDLMVDDVPGSITISCFDPLRREVAIMAMKYLIEDKRIHPGKIEEMVLKAKENLSKEIRKFGEKMVYDAGIRDVRPELISLLGRMKYRYSYGQSLATHTLEMVQIAENLAQILDANVYLAKKCALFHDIGKVVTAEQEGSHIELGAEIGKKYGLEKEVINAIFAHHDMAEPICIESAITKIADKISGGRPGARNNSVEVYATRIKQLEDTVKSFNGVEDAYAIHAGREVRVIIKPDIIDDSRMEVLVHDIAKKVEKENTYPGVVKITLIRETRSEAEAK